MSKCLGMDIENVEAIHKIHINGDRNEPLIEALTTIKHEQPGLFKELSKVIQFNYWDGYPLTVTEP